MFLPNPKGKQKDVLYLAAPGHHAVLGTAGSGKTTIAVLRAAHLSDKSNPHHGRGSRPVHLRDSPIPQVGGWDRSPPSSPRIAAESCLLR